MYIQEVNKGQKGIMDCIMKRTKNLFILSLGGVIGMAVVCMVLVTPRIAIAANATEDFQTFCREALSQKQVGFDQIVQSHKGDPTVEAYVKRAVSIDHVAQLLVDCLSSSKDNPGGAPASDIMREYEDQFADKLPGCSESEQRILDDYLAVKFNFATDYVSRLGGKVVADGDKPLDEVVRLCLTIPLLRAYEQEWTIDRVRSLPVWTRQPKSLAAAESFALQFLLIFFGVVVIQKTLD